MRDVILAKGPNEGKWKRDYRSSCSRCGDANLNTDTGPTIMSVI